MVCWNSPELTRSIGFELFYSGEPFEQTFFNGYAGQDQDIRYQFRVRQLRHPS